MEISQRLARLERPNLLNQASYIVPTVLQRFSLHELPAQRLLSILQTLIHPGEPKADDQTKKLNIRNKAKYLTSKADFQAGGANDEWRIHLNLGEGGYGHVASWVKRDDQNNIIDEVAVKEQRGDPSRFAGWDRQDPRKSLLMEAVVQNQLNQGDCENIVHLRGYKFFAPSLPPASIHPSPSSGDKERWRFYLEVAPHATLHDLADRYRYWNQYLPEPFLWHVFDSLACAISEMLNVTSFGLPPGSQGNRVYGREIEVLNLDIKSENIFLGYPEHRDTTPSEQPNFGGTKKYNYPVVKVGDFGLANFTFDGDPLNPGTHWYSGTLYYQSPEQTLYGAKWKHRGSDPTRNARARNSVLGSCSSLDMECGGRLRDFDHINNRLQESSQLRHPAHVWAIGKIVYDLMTLQGSEHYIRNSTKRYDEYRKWNKHQIIDFDKMPFAENSQSGQSPYSDELTDLLEDCMRPMIDFRPGINEVRQRTQEGMQTWDDLWAENCEDMPSDGGNRDVDHPKLFYRNNEINTMPQGNARFPQPYGEYFSLKVYERSDPDLPKLRPPFDLMQGVETHYERFERKKKRLMVPLPVTLENGQLRWVEQDRHPNEYDELGNVADESEAGNAGAQDNVMDIQNEHDEDKNAESDHSNSGGKKTRPGIPRISLKRPTISVLGSGGSGDDSNGGDNPPGGVAPVRRLVLKMPQTRPPGEDYNVQPGLADNGAVEAEESEHLTDSEDEHTTDGSDNDDAPAAPAVALPIPAPMQPQPLPPVQPPPPPPNPTLQTHQPPAINTNLPVQINLRIPSAFTDPSDAEYDVAVKSLREARRKSYYRLKPTHYSQRDPKKLRLKIRRKADQPKSASTFDYAKNHKRLRRAKVIAQHPVNPPRTAAEQLQLWRDEVTRLGLPELPPDVDADDESFRWFMGHYLRRRANGGLEWWDHEAAVPQWREQEVWPDTEQNRLLGRVGKPRLRGG